MTLVQFEFVPGNEVALRSISVNYRSFLDYIDVILSQNFIHPYRNRALMLFESALIKFSNTQYH